MNNDLPPGVYRNDSPITQTADDQAPIKPDMKDFVALTLAAYSIILPHVLLVIGGIVGVFFLLNLLFSLGK
ncbi:MAG: hypothetical protein ACK41E_07020 [Deinococcales bacterium]